jgi:Zn-dependent protease
MLHFSIFGIPVHVQPFFWITMALIGGAFGATTPEAILLLILFILAGFISILIHELGHALTLKAFRVPSEITLQAFGGFAAYPGGRLSRPQSFLVTAAGPVIQLLLAGLAFVILANVPAIYQNPNVGYFFYTLVEISAFWAVLNLLPILPLDGGQLLNSLLGPARIKITLWVTILVSSVVAVVALYHSNFRDLLFPVFLASFAFQAFQALKQIGGSR